MTHQNTPIPDDPIRLTRRRAAALTDAELVDYMRLRDVIAWGEFDLRFRAPLEQFARRAGVPRWDAAVCVGEVLETEGMRLAFGNRELPRSLVRYLGVAVRNRFLTERRISERRVRRYADAAALHEDGVVRTVASADAVRASAGPLADDPRPIVVAALARWLERELSEEERSMLGWMAEQVPRRTIAEWLGISAEAAKKRCTRLAARVRALAKTYLAEAPPENREALRAFFRRVGLNDSTLESTDEPRS